MLELPRLPRRPLAPLLLGALVGLVLAGAWRGYQVHTATSAPDATLVGHTATLLADGRVLVVGGEDGAGPHAEAFLLDPATAAWRPAGHLRAARRDHAAVRLPSGDVLVVGGSNGTGPLASAERYRPDRATWQPARAMPSSRAHPAALVLDGGLVLVAGPDASAELYDPVRDAWSSAAPPTAPHPNPTLLHLPAGRVLLLGSDANPPEVFDQRANAWTALAPGPALGQPFVPLPDGRVLAGLGDQEALVTYQMHLLDLTSGASSPTGTMALNRRASPGVLLPDGRVLIVGGTVVAGNPPRGIALASNELYDPAANRWAPAASMTLPRVGHALTSLPDGRVLAIGGAIRAGPPAEIYDPQSDRWSATVPTEGSEPRA
jgi:hypothetical protein